MQVPHETPVEIGWLNHQAQMTAYLTFSSKNQLILSHERPTHHWVLKVEEGKYTLRSSQKQSQNLRIQVCDGTAETLEEQKDEQKQLLLVKEMMKQLQEENQLLKHRLSSLNQSNNEKEQMIGNLQKLEIKGLQIPEPVAYAPIVFTDRQKEVRYTDCLQVSILRLLHLFFGEDGSINMDKLQLFMTKNKACKRLIDYFEMNNKYQMKHEFYETEKGLQIRAKWCQFLNKSNLFNLKLEKRYELAATMLNVFAFFRGFFPRLKVHYDDIKELTYESVLTKQVFKSYEKTLNEIYSQISLNYNIKCEISSDVIYQKNYIYFSSIQHLTINGDHMLDWQIYESYDVQNKFIRDRISGHSDLRIPIKQQ